MGHSPLPRSAFSLEKLSRIGFKPCERLGRAVLGGRRVGSTARWCDDGYREAWWFSKAQLQTPWGAGSKMVKPEHRGADAQSVACEVPSRAQQMRHRKSVQAQRVGRENSRLHAHGHFHVMHELPRFHPVVVLDHRKRCIDQPDLAEDEKVARASWT